MLKAPTERKPRQFRVTQVVAVARNGVIGRNGTLPWHVPSDLKTFRRLTIDKPVIMGRKTFVAIGKPLPRRDNIVVTRQADFTAPDAIVCGDISAALNAARTCAAARDADEIAIIGGAEIYAATRTITDRIYLTLIDAEPDGDASFAMPDPSTWTCVARAPIAPDERDDHAAELLTYEQVDTTAVR
ncbi:MAG: dihydrofolate reductase [Pseudomonadota bacterium]